MAEDPKQLKVGDFKIARAVLERIAEMSVAQAPGVTSVGEVIVTQEGEDVVVDVAVTVDYKTVYPDVGRDVQETVAKGLKSTADLSAKAVNVMVERLDFRG